MDRLRWSTCPLYYIISLGGRESVWGPISEQERFCLCTSICCLTVKSSITTSRLLLIPAGLRASIALLWLRICRPFVRLRPIRTTRGLLPYCVQVEPSSGSIPKYLCNQSQFMCNIAHNIAHISYRSLWQKE